MRPRDQEKNKKERGRETGRKRGGERENGISIERGERERKGDREKNKERERESEPRAARVTGPAPGRDAHHGSLLPSRCAPLRWEVRRQLRFGRVGRGV